MERKTAEGETRKLMWMKVDELLIDPRYQRKLKERNLRRIIDGPFDPDKLGVLYVSERANGKRYLLDGQHRKEALLRMNYGQQLVPVLVHYGLTPQEEADLFDGANTHAPTTPIERFKARLFAKDEDAVRMNEAVEAGGYVLDVYNNHTEKGLVCVTALQEIVGVAGELGLPFVTRVLKVTRATWGFDRTSKRADFIQGVAGFLTLWGDTMNEKRFIEKLSKVPPSKILRDVALMKETAGTDKQYLVARALASQYNKGLRSGHLPSYESLASAIKARRVAHTPGYKISQEQRKRLREAMLKRNDGKWHRRAELFKDAAVAAHAMQHVTWADIGMVVEQKKEGRDIFYRLKGWTEAA